MLDHKSIQKLPVDDLGPNAISDRAIHDVRRLPAPEDEVRILEAHKIEWLHIDVMDGHYVPNFTMGIDYCRALAGATRIPLDVHLMIEHPDRHIEPFCAIPGTRLTFHPETVRQPVRLIERIRELGGSPGIALDPGQTVDQFKHLIPLTDQVLVMTVSPGYAGQKLIPHCLDKISEVRDFLSREKLSIDIEVDGNVSWKNTPKWSRRALRFWSPAPRPFLKNIAHGKSPCGSCWLC